jgi:hypothetical protein
MAEYWNSELKVEYEDDGILGRNRALNWVLKGWYNTKDESG